MPQLHAQRRLNTVQRLSASPVFQLLHSADVGCVTCRARKVVCDDRQPTCEECARNDFECLRDQVSSPSTIHTEDVSGRERTRLACMPCRTRKIRCAGPVDGKIASKCPRCDRLSLDCAWVPKRPARSNSSRLRTGPPSDDGSVITGSFSAHLGELRQTIESTMADRTQLNTLIRLYFSTVHYYGCLRFIHEPSFFRLLEVDKAPRELAAVMVACALRYACEPSYAVMARADSLFDDTLQSLRDRIDRGYGAIELMAMVLAHHYEHARGRFSSAWLLWGNAVRMMQFLCIHTLEDTYPHPPSSRLNPLLKREALRRLAWAVFYQDTMVDAGRHGVHLVSESDLRIQLPCDEATFVRGLDVTTAPLNDRFSHAPSPSTLVRSPTHNEGPTNLGMCAYLLRAAALRRRVLHFNSLIKHSIDSSRKLLDDLTLFEVELKQVTADLPEELSYSEHNLFIHSAARTGFVQLHLLRHNCFLMIALARLSAAGRDPSLEAIAFAARRERIRHAIPVSRIVADILRLNINCDPFVSVQAYTSLEILLFDPLRLSQIDPSMDPKEPRFREALAILLEMLRRHTMVEERVRLLRIEACRRLSHCGFADLLSDADRNLCKSDVDDPNQNETEFDFRAFRWHRFEPSRSKGHTTSDDSFLHPDPASVGVSRAASPHLDVFDAGVVVSDTRNSPLVPLVGSNPSPVFVKDIGVALNGTSRSVSEPTLSDTRVGELPVLQTPSTSRWFDLDFDSGPQSQTTTLNELGQQFPQAQASSDDFFRFLEQAGCAGVEETDPFAWITHV